MRKYRRAGAPAPKLPYGLALGGALIALPFSFLLGSSSRVVAYGNSLMVMAILLLSLAWFAYLRKDGIRILPERFGRKYRSGGGMADSRRGSRGTGLESRDGAGAGSEASGWQDRVPGLGLPPEAPGPMPGADGPDSESYRRLASAEAALRARIAGEERAADPAFARRAAAAGAALFLAALAFQYLPQLLKISVR